MTKKYKVYSEVETVINNSMTLKEKLVVLDAIKFEGRPGCKAAEELYRMWRSRISRKQSVLKQNLHSNDSFSYKNHYNRYYYPIFPFVHKMVSDYETIGRDNEVLPLIEQLASLVKESPFCTSNNSASLNDVRSGLFVYQRLGDYYECRQTLKEAGRIISRYADEYKRTVLPAVKAYKEKSEQCEKEQQEWHRQLGMAKYKVGTVYTQQNYLTSPLTATKDDNVLLYPYSFVPHEEVDEDWECYSKAWHRAHGPKRTVTDREVRVYKWGKGLIQMIELSKWKPGFMVEVVAQVLGLQQPKVEKSLRKFQPSPWVDVKRSVKRNGIQFYNLTMGKYTVGVVAYDESCDIHYHGETKETALDGLRKKKEKLDSDKQRWAMEGSALLNASEAHDRWGFCWPGMTEFANAIGFDVDGSYTVAQLRNAVNHLSDRRILGKYRRELEIAKIINY